MYMLWNHHCVVEWVVIVTASDSCSFVATNQGQGNSVTKSSIIVQPINVSKVAGSNPAFAIFGAIFQVDFSSSVWGGRAVTSNFTGLVDTEAAFACKRTFLSIRDKVVEDVPPVLDFDVSCSQCLKFLANVWGKTNWHQKEWVRLKLLVLNELLAPLETFF